MQEKVEKYIYYVRDNKYRVKFLKTDKKNNMRINFDQYVYGTLDDAIKIRDDKLKDNGLTLDKEEKNETDLFDLINEDTKPKKEKKRRKTVDVEDKSKIDKYIYEIEKGKKYKIFIRKGGCNGKKGDYYSKIYEGTLAQAKRERDMQLANFKLKNGKNNKGNIKFIDFVRIYYKEYAEIELSPATVSSGKKTLKIYVLPEMANMPLNKIDALVIQRLINNLKDRDKQRLDENGNVQKLSITSVNNVYRLLRKILNKAIAWDYIETNPVKKVKAPGVSKEEKKSYNRDELLQILNILKHEDILTEVLFTIAICTGLRRGEIVGLHIEDIDFKNNIISVKRTVVWDNENKKILEKETKTKGSVRAVPIPLFCTETIKEYLKLRERIIQRFNKKYKNYVAPKNLFLSKYGGIMFPDTPSKKWLDFRNKHNEIKNVSLHGLRHSYCTMQMNDNSHLSPVDVQKLMGHSQLSTTFIYTHSNEDKTQEAISIFDKYYNDNKEIKINFNQMLSLYTRVNFASQRELNQLLKVAVNLKVDEEEKYSMIKQYIDNRYPIFKKIDISKINLNNVWDTLDKYKQKYGDEFILYPLE